MEDAAVIAVVVATAAVVVTVAVAAARKSGQQSKTTAKSSRSAAAPGKTANGIRSRKTALIPGKCASAATRTASAACTLPIAETDSGQILPIHAGSAARTSIALGNVRNKTYQKADGTCTVQAAFFPYSLRSRHSVKPNVMQSFQGSHGVLLTTPPAYCTIEKTLKRTDAAEAAC